MNGLVLVNKPVGPTSNQISLEVKQLLNIDKVGHCGTLDPNVSGVLPVLVGKGIKLLEYLQKHEKEYICVMNTEKAVDKKEMEKILKEFEGKIYQKPPKISAVAKHLRVRQIYEIKLLESKEKEFKFSVYCQHGTYIRKLVDDIGHLLGMKTEMVSLERIKVGHFTLKDCVKWKEFKEIKEKAVKPLEYVVKKFSKVYVKKGAAQNIIKGAPLMAPGIEKLTGHIVKGEPVAIFDQNKLIAMGISEYDKKQILEMKKGIVIKTKKVLV